MAELSFASAFAPAVPRAGSKVRPDIQALRALAVLSVFLYHIGVKAIPGGFLGVDVFFVISGYLITGSIDSSIQRGRFTLHGFWIRRIRRLFPASSVVIIATLRAAYFLLSPDEVDATARSAVAAMLSVSNILFWHDVGYFDPVSQMKPLLHTWTLGVEEQFYLIWPIALVLLARYFNRRVSLFVSAQVG